MTAEIGVKWSLSYLRIHDRFFCRLCESAGRLLCHRITRLRCLNVDKAQKLPAILYGHPGCCSVYLFPAAANGEPDCRSLFKVRAAKHLSVAAYQLLVSEDEVTHEEGFQTLAEGPGFMLTESQ